MSVTREFQKILVLVLKDSVAQKQRLTSEITVKKMHFTFSLILGSYPECSCQVSSLCVLCQCQLVLWCIMKVLYNNWSCQYFCRQVQFGFFSDCAVLKITGMPGCLYRKRQVCSTCAENEQVKWSHRCCFKGSKGCKKDNQEAASKVALNFCELVYVYVGSTPLVELYPA